MTDLSRPDGAAAVLRGNALELPCGGRWRSLPRVARVLLSVKRVAEGQRMHEPSTLSPPPVPRRVPPDAARAASLRVALQEGVGVSGLLPCPIVAFLVEQLGLEPAYVERRISTIFLDAEVVDDPARALVRDGSVLALSAALPGLVGATLRKGGYYSTMRAGITHHARAAGEPSAPGLVRLKLFNLIIAELAPALLAHGVVLEPARAAELLADLGEPAPPPGAAVLFTTRAEGSA